MIEGISFVIPAYNEEENIGQVIADCRETAQKISQHHEIIIVDDGSMDGTTEKIRKMTHADHDIVLIRHDKNMGVGAATRDGFASACYPYVFYMDGDGQFNVCEIEMMLPYCQDYDFVVGYREKRADPGHRRINAFLYNTLIKILFRLPVRDVNCAFKLIRRESLLRLAPSSKSAFYLAEILLAARQQGMRIKEIAVSHYPRKCGRPTGAKPMVMAQAIKDCLIYRLRMKVRTP